MQSVTVILRIIPLISIVDPNPRGGGEASTSPVVACKYDLRRKPAGASPIHAAQAPCAPTQPASTSSSQCNIELPTSPCSAPKRQKRSPKTTTTITNKGRYIQLRNNCTCGDTAM